MLLQKGCNLFGAHPDALPHIIPVSLYQWGLFQCFVHENHMPLEYVVTFIPAGRTVLSEHENKDNALRRKRTVEPTFGNPEDRKIVLFVPSRLNGVAAGKFQLFRHITQIAQYVAAARLGIASGSCGWRQSCH